jgi:restriction system protein
MGSIISTRIEMISEISEIIGYKAGIALTRSQILEHLPDYSEYLNGPDEETLLIRSEEYQEMIGTLLHHLGNIPSPEPLFPTIALYHKYRNDKDKYKLMENTLQLFQDLLPELEKASPANEPIDLTPFLKEAENRYGSKGLMMAIEFTEAIELFVHSLPWSKYRRTNWIDTAELEDLFKSEALDTYYGTFFDQRFIDYLSHNFESISKINWRKFEGLTAEFFNRQGFYVKIGRGRGDENIDARIWPEEDHKDFPPTILVQCKRQKEKVGKMVVKALYADIIAEHANSGLIVTTSALSPGAEKVSIVRAYPILQANRGTLRVWIEAMRSPYAGIFMID